MTFLFMGMLVAFIIYLLLHPVLSDKHKIDYRRSDEAIVIAELESKKSGLFREIKEIELDYQMDKIDDGDFEDLTNSYRSKAMAVMEELDSLKGVSVKKEYSFSPEYSVPEDRQSGFCTECGNPLFSDASFCGVCGNQV